jgi:hypothetical protein
MAATMCAAIAEAIGLAAAEHGWGADPAVTMLWGPASPSFRTGSPRTGPGVPNWNEGFVWHDRRAAHEAGGIPPRTSYGRCPHGIEHQPDFQVGTVVTVRRYKPRDRWPEGDGYAERCERYTYHDLAYVLGVGPEASQLVDLLRELELERRLRELESAQAPATDVEMLALFDEVAAVPVYAGAHRH